MWSLSVVTNMGLVGINIGPVVTNLEPLGTNIEPMGTDVGTFDHQYGAWALKWYYNEVIILR